MFPGNIEGFSPVDAFYFTAMTMLTVGYGDVVPHTGAGKIAAVLFALVSVGIALYSINIIAMLAFRHRLEDAQWLSQKMRKR
jgi:voltage-gated potassium channel